MSEENVGVRTFEFHDEKSDKFWTIELSGLTHTVCYGRVGTSGQSKTKEFESNDKAFASYEKLISEKLKKGYQEVEDPSQSRSAQLAREQQAQQQYEPFLKSIQEDPDNVAHYEVFSDWLQENGDPRGEMIRVQLQLEDDKVSAGDRKKLKAKEKSLLKSNATQWLGGLAPELVANKWPEALGYRSNSKPYQWEFVRGFLGNLNVEYLTPHFAKSLIESSSVSMLQSLAIEDTPNGEVLGEEYEEYAESDWGWDDLPGLEELYKGKFPNLRRFEIDGYDASATGVQKVLKNMPRLEHLVLDARDVEIESISKCKLPNLKSIRATRFDENPLEALAANKSLKKLESINFFPHMLEPGDDPYLDLPGLRALCRSKNLPNLKSLTLNCSDFGDEGINELINSGLIERLEELDLQHGATTDVGARLLIEARPNQLLRLNLTGNYLSNAVIQELQELKCELQASNQESGDPDVEKRHLWYGDME